MVRLLRLVVLLLPFICCSFHHVTAQTTHDGPHHDFTQAEVLKRLLQNYDKNVRPNAGAEPVDVGITMYCLAISSISDSKMEYTVDVYLRQVWKDPRLNYSNFTTSAPNYFAVGEDTVVKSLWIPDTFFPDAKSSVLHQNTVPNVFMRLAPDGTVFRSIRLSITANCFMDMTHFPMDIQKCNLMIESYGFTARDITYRWMKGHINSMGISAEVELPHFNLVGHRLSESNIVLSSGKYSRLEVAFVFQRDMGFYLTRVYIPAAVIVLLSWLSLWLRSGTGPTRLVVSVSCIVVMTLLHIGTLNDAVAKVSYVTSVDIYLFVCFFLVVMPLAEYILVESLSRHEKDKLPLLDKDEKDDSKKTTADKLDFYSKIVHLAVFLFFNFLYWVVYLNVGSVGENLVHFARK